MPFPDIDPVLFAIGPFAIRWYSLAYLAGVFFVLFWIKKSNKKDPFLSEKAYDDLLGWIILSIILGGRAGYVLFYNLPFFLNNPLEIIKFWHGGMSFHGGLIGSILGMMLFAKKYKVDFLKLTDSIAIAAPIGLFFGRIANFINMELYGRVTDSKFGIIFPNAGPLPRHPSQLYEAFLEGLLLFILLLTLNHFTKLSKLKGIFSGLFLIFYGSFRIMIENFREPDEQIGFLFAEFTMGQLLSIPLIIFGLIIIIFRLKKEKIKKISC
jgi:phosphatidylglycerol:prolipoprotein diacylglycerol transferase